MTLKYSNLLFIFVAKRYKHKITDLLLRVSTLYLSRTFTIKIAEFKSIHISCKIWSSELLLRSQASWDMTLCHWLSGS